MKFNCDYFKQQRAARRDRKYKEFQEKTKSHKWYAWYPVKVAEGDCRWLEYVSRSIYIYTTKATQLTGVIYGVINTDH